MSNKKNDWKTEHANRATDAVQHPLVQQAITECADNMRIDLEGLPAYGLNKIALYAAQVARAQALGFDPDLLRLTPSEANSELMRRAAEAVYRGVPTTVIDPEDDR